MSSHLEVVGEDEVGAPPLLRKDGGDVSLTTREGLSSTSALQHDGRLGDVVVKIGQPHFRRDSSRLINRRDPVSGHHGARSYSSAGGGTGGRRWSESSNHSSLSASRRISAVGTIFESPHISVGMQLVLVAPAFLYAVAVVMWLFEDQDIEISRELAPVSFAALCVHLFAAGEIPFLTFWEVVHYWFHAACEVLVANDYTRKIGGGVWGVFLTSVLMLIFWPTGWVMVRRLRIKMNHPSRTSRFPNVGESAMRSGVPLVCLSLYLGTQSLSCLVYEGVTDCALKNSGTRHLNYSLGTLYVLWMLFRHLTGSNAKQVMLFRLRHHQSYAVVFSFLSTVYSLYEYAALGIPYNNHVAELMADLIIFVCWFLSIVTIISAAPREHTPAILYLSTVIPDRTLQIESLEVAPDGAFNESDRVRLSMGPLSRDRGPLGRMLRDTGRPLNMSQRGALPTDGPLASPRDGLSTHGNWMDWPGSLHSGGSRHFAAAEPLDGDSASTPPVSGTELERSNRRANAFAERRPTAASLFRGMSDGTAGHMRLGRRSAGVIPTYEAMRSDKGETKGGEDASNGEEKDGEENGPSGTLEPEEYTHPLLKYYRMHGRIPPLSFFTTYLCEIVFFWRFMLFTFTVGYKLFLSLAAYYIMNRHWAQIFTPLSTSALTVSWLLTLGCDPRDRVSTQMMNVHFWFHALSEIPDIIVWIKNGQHLEVIFNVLILLVVWPWVYVAYRRVLKTLRAKYRGQEEDTSVKLFWESSFLMAVEFYLAFQANGCLVHAAAGQESDCDNLIHSNLISGMNIILIFLVVRVMLFKLGDLTVTRTLHLALRPYEVLVIIFSVISGLVSIYFLANREDGVTEIGEVRQGLEWVTMFLWIVVCLLMAHLSPPVDSVRAKALAELAMASQSGSGTDHSAVQSATGPVIPEGLEERTNDLALAMAASRRKGNRPSGPHSPTRISPNRRATTGDPRRDKSPASSRTSVKKGWRDWDQWATSTSSDGGGGETNGSRTAGEDATSHEGILVTPTSSAAGTNGVSGEGVGGGAMMLDEGVIAGDAKDNENGCCCSCWESFVLWVDKRNTQNNLPIFRVLYFSSTVVYFFIMLGVAAGVIQREYATAVVGISFASVCSHWLISIEHPTSTMEIVHLLLHACTEAISVLLWVSVRDWTQALYTASAFFAVYPCLFYGIQALKLGLHRKFSDHVALVREAMKIFMRSSVLLMVLLYLSFECIGCLNARSEVDCTALLYSNTEVGLSVVLGFLSFLGLIVMQDITARHFLQLNFTWPQVAVLAFSLAAVGLCIFSLASRHFNKLTTDIWEHMVELATLFSWYAALLILWIRRPWYDMSWGDNDSLVEEVTAEDGRGAWEEVESDVPAGDGELVPEWVQSQATTTGKPSDMV